MSDQERKDKKGAREREKEKKTQRKKDRDVKKANIDQILLTGKCSEACAHPSCWKWK